MKFVLIASFIALASAGAIYQGKNIYVGDNGITITNEDGYRVFMERPTTFSDVSGKHPLNIVVSGPNFAPKLIQVNDDYWYTTTATQEDALYNILREYQGTVNDVSYEKFLYRIQQGVKKGLIHQHVYQILNALNQHDFEVLVQGLGHILDKPYFYGSEYPSTFDYGKFAGAGQFYPYSHDYYYANPLMKTFFGDNKYFNKYFYGQQYFGGYPMGKYYNSQVPQHMVEQDFEQQHLTDFVHDNAVEKDLLYKQPFYYGQYEHQSYYPYAYGRSYNTYDKQQQYGLGGQWNGVYSNNFYGNKYGNNDYYNKYFWGTPSTYGQNFWKQYSYGRQFPYYYGQQYYGQQGHQYYGQQGHQYQYGLGNQYNNVFDYYYPQYAY